MHREGPAPVRKRERVIAARKAAAKLSSEGGEIRRGKRGLASRKHRADSRASLKESPGRKHNQPNVQVETPGY
jgi:hypothetical protein